MEKLNELKHGLEEAWHSLADGWKQLRERAAGAVTRFTPSSKQAASAASPPATAEAEAFRFPSPGWALLAGDVFEDSDRVIVRLEIPGMEKQDFDVEIRPDVLVVRGEKRYERESDEGHYRLRQCAYGSFHRSIPLPVPVIGDKAKASYHNGVLRIELPKVEHARRRRIEVRTS